MREAGIFYLFWHLRYGMCLASKIIKNLPKISNENKTILIIGNNLEKSKLVKLTNKATTKTTPAVDPMAEAMTCMLYCKPIAETI